MLSRITTRGTVLSTLAIAVALLSAASRPTAASAGSVASRAAADTAAVRTAVVQVHNYALSRRIIYVTTDGVRRRIGTVAAASIRDLTVPQTYVTGSPMVRFVANLYSGSRREESQRMHLFAGDTVDMVIQG